MKIGIPAEDSVCQEKIMSTLVLDKKADLAGPGIGDYKELKRFSQMITTLC